MVYAYKMFYVGDTHNADEHLKACRKASLNYAGSFRELKDICGGKLHRHENGKGYYCMKDGWEYQAVKTDYRSILQAPMPAA